MDSSRRILAIAAMAAQVLFVGGWLVLGWIEGDGYAPGRHEISDLAALTANHATLDRVTLGLSGAITIAFALSLRPLLGWPVWFVALSLPGLDGFSDAFFRLDCRAVDAGCDAAASTESWHGTVHVLAATVAVIATAVAPFALAWRMRRTSRWRDLARPALGFGLLVVLAIAATAAGEGTPWGGWAQRVASVLVSAGVAALAARVLRNERAPQARGALGPVTG